LLWTGTLLSELDSIEEVVRNDQAGALLSELENSDVFSVDDVDTSELDDLALLEHWRSSKSQEVVLVAVVNEVDGVLLGIDFSGLRMMSTSVETTLSLTASFSLAGSISGDHQVMNLILCWPKKS
jgi:hypothetical protein